MPRYLLTGDLTHAGRVSVAGKDLEDAITNAEIGEFDEVYDEDHKNLGFVFCGDTEGGVEVLDNEDDDYEDVAVNGVVVAQQRHIDIGGTDQ